MTWSCCWTGDKPEWNFLTRKGGWIKSWFNNFGWCNIYYAASYRGIKNRQPYSQEILSQATTWQQEMKSWQIKLKYEKNIHSGFKISMFRTSVGIEKWINL
jgi:hypothetical protein